MTTPWVAGDRILRREILGFDPLGGMPDRPWHLQCWETLEADVVVDDGEELVIHVPSGSPLGFPAGDWPTPDGKHPWHGREAWTGHGCLMVHPPGQHHAIWHFWSGPERTFVGWYINIQTAHRRERNMLDTQDLELDLQVWPDGTWVLKDDDVMEDRVAEGRFSAELVAWVREHAAELGDRLDHGDHWWDHRWTTWKPGDPPPNRV